MGTQRGQAMLTPATGLDEEQLGLPAQAGAASPVEDVHHSLDEHGPSVCTIDGPWELQVAGLEDQEPGYKAKQ